MIKHTLRTIDFSMTAITIKIGGGVPVYRHFLELLDEELPPQVSLQIVGEAGANLFSPEVKNRRGFRYMISATRIARRPGYLYSRRKPVDQES